MFFYSFAQNKESILFCAKLRELIPGFFDTKTTEVDINTKFGWVETGFWITLPKNHFIENFWPKGHLTEKTFDRTPFYRMPFDRKFIWPNRRLTERRLTESSFYRKFILPKGHMTDFFPENGHLTESTFDKKCHLTEKKLRTRSFDRKLFLKMIIWPKDHLTESFFKKMVIWPKGHLTESSFDRKFFFEKWSFDRTFFFGWSFPKNCHLTDCS
jgi:hypothetical protein